MMIAEAGLPCPQRIACGEHFTALRPALFFTRLLATKGEVDPLAGNLAIGRRKGLGQHQLARQAKNIVDQARARFGRIFLDRQHGGEAASARARSLQSRRGQS